jgi:hypothetical protein
MKNRHHLKAIVKVPTSPPYDEHNSRGVKKSIEKHCCTHTFHPTTVVRTISWRHGNYYIGPGLMTLAAMLIGLTNMSLDVDVLLAEVCYLKTL